ncbi:TauD/TfdA family dioxygenase [Streptomyces sp. NPDC053560]|uniref:TauD/TfdA family dioxygenase n=1 Tax=Streptomyces sp. NPDC053560 TaxID=3365711 RepID=UPI0037D302A3
MKPDALAPTGLPVRLDPGKPPVLTTPSLDDADAARAWLAEHRTAIRAELLRHGQLLLRGLPMRRPEEFARLRDVLVQERAAYREKATPRSSYGEDVYSSTDLPRQQAIHLHNENSYTLDFPGLLLFGCLQAPDEGGATTVADVREVLAALPAPLVERFRTHGWLLTRHYHEHVGLPWPTAFATDRREDVEEYCARNLIGCEWVGESALRTAQRRSALVRHPVTGEEVWFNHAAFWSRWSLDEEVLDVLEMTYGEDALPFDTAFGDGTALTEDDVHTLNAAYEAATRRERWQVGDLMLVDNVLSAHGRDAYEGERKILVAMGEPVALDSCAPTVPPTPHAVA